MTRDPHLRAVILAGGAGSRFWPVSTPSRPKQLLPLAGDVPLIRQTVDRILPLVPPGRVRILTGRHLADATLADVPSLDRSNLFIEPAARGTAPVLAWAAHRLLAQDEDAIMISLHSDHVIADPDSFRAALQDASTQCLAAERLFTLGARPSRTETGYGYIEAGAPLVTVAGTPASGRAVTRFVEKPDADTAARYVSEGMLWNTGIFVWPARLLIDEFRRHTPEIADLLPLLDEGDTAGFFDQAPALSIDHGLLERSDRVAVLPTDFGWDDVGTWDAIARTRQPDTAGNVAVGAAHFVDARDCIAWSDAGDVVLFGCDDLVVVRDGDVTFVAPRDRTPALKQMLEQLPERLRKRT